MTPKRVRRPPVRKAKPVKRAAPRSVTRAELDEAIRVLHEHIGESVNDLRSEVQVMCREIAAEVNRRELQTQFARIAQLQQEIEGIKKRIG